MTAVFFCFKVFIVKKARGKYSWTLHVIQLNLDLYGDLR